MAQPTATRKWTYADYLELPDDGKQHQIVGGRHFVTAAPRLKHQAVLGSLYLEVAQHVRAHDLGLVLFSPVDFVLSKHDVVQPDLIFIARERLDQVEETMVAIAPDLAVEVLSPSTRKLDLDLKRDLYERHAVREYWIVDVESETVEVLRLEGGRFTAAETLSKGDLLESRVVHGLKLSLAALFA